MRTRVWKQFAPFFFYTTAAAAFGLAAAVNDERSIGARALLFAGGLLSWVLIEYFLHRFAFHHQEFSVAAAVSRVLSASHLAHHERPQAVDRLFASLRMSAPVAACYCLLMRAIWGDWWASAYMFVGLVCGYFCYEWLHYQAHHGAPRSRALRYMRKYHLLHHHRTPDLRFGVTSPAIDYLFGTFRPVGKRTPGGAAARRRT